MLHMHKPRERCPKDLEWLRIRNRERQKQCRARKREKAKRDAAFQMGGNLISSVENLFSLKANKFPAMFQEESSLTNEVLTHPPVQYPHTPVTSVKKNSEDNLGIEYMGLFNAGTPVFNLKPNVGAGHDQGVSSNECFDKDSHDILQSRIKIEDSRILHCGKQNNVTDSTDMNLPKNRDEWCSCESHQAATLQIIEPSPKNVSIECGPRAPRHHRKWKKDARMRHTHNQTTSSLQEVPMRSPPIMLMKDVFSSQGSLCDLNASKTILFSTGEMNSKLHVGVDTAASCGRTNWKTAARRGGWDSTMTRVV